MYKRRLPQHSPRKYDQASITNPDCIAKLQQKIKNDQILIDFIMPRSEMHGIEIGKDYTEGPIGISVNQSLRSSHMYT